GAEERGRIPPCGAEEENGGLGRDQGATPRVGPPRSAVGGGAGRAGSGRGPSPASGVGAPAAGSAEGTSADRGEKAVGRRGSRDGNPRPARGRSRRSGPSPETRRSCVGPDAESEGGNPGGSRRGRLSSPDRQSENEGFPEGFGADWSRKGGIRRCTEEGRTFPGRFGGSLAGAGAAG